MNGNMNIKSSHNRWLKFASALIVLQGCGRMDDLWFTDENDTQEVESFQLVHETEFSSLSIHDNSISDSIAKQICFPIYTHIESPIFKFNAGDSIAILDVDHFFEYSVSIYTTWRAMVYLKLRMEFDSTSSTNPRVFHISGTATSGDLKWMNKRIIATVTADSVPTTNLSRRCYEHFAILIETETHDSLAIEDVASCTYTPKPVFFSSSTLLPVQWN